LTVSDNVVITERIDTLTFGQTVIPLAVMGVFEFRDGRISAWCDYFDMATITTMLAVGE
jgi:limonene-1,2-epoxide hydrolase